MFDPAKDVLFPSDWLGGWSEERPITAPESETFDGTELDKARIR